MEISIRPVRPGDESALAYIQTESWKAAFRAILSPETLQNSTNLEKATKMYRRLLENDIGHGYLLSLDGKAHGIAWWDAARDASLSGKAELICIHSLPDNWRRGCGRAMMERVLADVKAAGYAEIALWVFQKNERARAFYEAMGFRATEHTKIGLDSVEMCYIKNL